MKNLYATLLTGAALLVASGTTMAQSHPAKGPRQLNAVTGNGSPHGQHFNTRGAGPVNDNCSSVTFQSLAIGGSLTFTGDLTGATLDNDYEAGSAIENNALGYTPPLATVWHGFSTSDCADVVISYCGIDPAFGDVWIVISTGCPVGDANIIFNTSYNATTCSDGNFTVNFLNLPAGDYYVPVMQDITNGADGPYSITVSATACIPPPTPPANDDCANAISLTPSTWCNFSYFTGLGGTQSEAAITCNNFTGNANDDVWFSFVATATDMSVGVQGAEDGDGNLYTGYDAVIEVRSGACPGTYIDCADATLSGEAEEVVLSGLTVGSTYRVRVYDWYNNYWPDHTFGICVVEGQGVNIGIQENTAADWSVYPNPGTGLFQLQYAGASAAGTIEVIDVTGRVVYSQQAQLNSGMVRTLDLTDLGAGNYNVRLTANGVRTEQRLVKN